MRCAPRFGGRVKGQRDTRAGALANSRISDLCCASEREFFFAFAIVRGSAPQRRGNTVIPFEDTVRSRRNHPITRGFGNGARARKREIEAGDADDARGVSIRSAAASQRHFQTAICGNHTRLLLIANAYALA